MNFNSKLNEKPENIYTIYYPTIARRVVEQIVELPVDGSKDTHTLTLHPQDPGIVFEKIVIDLGGYERQYLFGKEQSGRAFYLPIAVLFHVFARRDAIELLEDGGERR